MSSLRATQYPHFPANPYQSMMADKLGTLGVTMADAESLKGLLGTVLLRRTDVVHLHWTQTANRAGRLRAVARYLLFALVLRAARLRRIGLVWTVHNAKPHEGRGRFLDRLYDVTAGALADRVIVQGPAGAEVARTDFRVDPRKISIVKHGNYAGLIQYTPPRAGPTPKRFLAWGQIRAYKGFGDLAASFADSEINAELTICGAAVDRDETARLVEIAGGSDKVTVRPEYLGDAELGRELARTDFVVLPYQNVLTSGALLMSLTAGRPVILPRIGDLDAYVDDRAAIFYRAGDGAGLFDAMRRACALAPGEIAEMSVAARRAADANGLDDAAEATRSVYLMSLPRQRGRKTYRPAPADSLPQSQRAAKLRESEL